MSPQEPMVDHAMRPHARHVLFIVDQLAALGGGERVLLELTRELPAHGYRCSLATLRPEIAPEIRGAIACPLHVFPLRNGYGLRAWGSGFRLRRLIRDQGVGVVQTFFESSDLWGGFHAGVWPRQLLRAGACPILISSRRDMGILRRGRHHALYRWINPVFDCVITVSEAVRATVLERESLPPDKVIAIPNGLNLSRAEAAGGVAQSRIALGLSQQAEVISTVGNLRRVKGTDVFLRAAAIVASQRPNAVFLVVGREAEAGFAAESRRLAEELGIAERVRFLGEARDVFPILRASDQFCLLSRSEGLPNSLLEAMACGLPCVAARVGGVPEIIRDGINGLLVPPGDPAAAAACICALLAEPEKAQSLAARARETVAARFSLDTMVRRYVALYDHLLGLAPEPPGEVA